MNLFNTLVNQALQNRADLALLRPVVEKEILHHDIIRELKDAGLLKNLTFIGGTCLRACYGSNRLSEDLDFTGGSDFKKEDLQALKNTLETELQRKYQCPITVTEPKAEKQSNVDTWKMQVNTQPERPDLPAQRINLDICAIPSYDKTPRTLLNHYGINLGTDNLVISTQAREEIFADKILALAMRPNRLKNRDLWDIGWLAQQAVKPHLHLLKDKLADHKVEQAAFVQQAEDRLKFLANEKQARADFEFEMRRFLPAPIQRSSIEQEDFWPYIVTTVREVVESAVNSLENRQESTKSFQM